METKYLLGIVIVILAIIAVGAYVLHDDTQTAVPVVVNNTTDDKIVNNTVNDTTEDTDDAVEEDTESSSSVVYYASVKTDKFHKPSCEWAQKISSKNLVTYDSRDDAIAAGKSPCQVCNP